MKEQTTEEDNTNSFHHLYSLFNIIEVTIAEFEEDA
jgi:hypothetical protein